MFQMRIEELLDFNCKDMIVGRDRGLLGASLVIFPGVLYWQVYNITLSIVISISVVSLVCLYSGDMVI